MVWMLNVYLQLSSQEADLQVFCRILLVIACESHDTLNVCYAEAVDILYLNLR